MADPLDDIISKADSLISRDPGTVPSTPGSSPGGTEALGTQANLTPGALFSPQPMEQQPMGLSGGGEENPPPLPQEPTPAPAPQMTPQEPVANLSTGNVEAIPQQAGPVSLDDIIAKADKVVSETPTPEHSAIQNYLGAANKRISDLANVAIGATNPVAQVSKILSGFGEKTISGGMAKLVDSKTLFDALGINMKSDEGSLAGHIGKNTVDSIVTLGAMQAAAPMMAAAEGISTSAYLQRAFGEAMLKHPWLGIIGDVLGATPGATVGEEYGGPAGALVGGVTGQVGVSTVTGLGKFASKLPKAVLGKVLDAVDAVSAKLGMNNEPLTALGQSPKGIPEVSEHLLEPARNAEQQARIAGSAVVEAADNMRKEIPYTVPHMEAKVALRDAMDQEKLAVQRADAYWDKLPPEARGKYSREMTAIRSQFADDVYPKQYAEDQIAGDTKIIQDRLNRTITGIAPGSDAATTTQYATRISDGINAAEKLATKIEGRYWDRVPLKEKMPERSGPLSDLDDFRASLVGDGHTEANQPTKFIKDLYRLFAPMSEPGVMQPLPTLQKLRGVVTEMRTARMAEIAKDAPSNSLIMNYSKLESMTNKWMSEAFPKNVEIAQARAFSRTYHELFSQSELYPFIKQGRQGQPKVHPEDTLDELMSKDRGLSDLYTMTQRLMKEKRIPMQKDAYPTALNPQEKETLKALQGDVEAGLRSQFKDAVSATEADPLKLSKLLDKWEPRVQSFSKVAGEFQQANKSITEAMQGRRTIENSAFAKYAKNDPQKAIDTVWGSSNPAATARELVYGRVGVGGFNKDPLALEGFRAGLLDKLFSTGRNDPYQVQQLLAGRHGRLLETALGKDTYERLERIVGKALEVDKGEKNNSFLQAMVTVGRIAAVKVSALMPRFGRGGEIQQAAIFSQVAKRMITNAFAGGSPTAMMTEAVRNPTFEAMLFSKVPESAKEVNASIALMRRIQRMDVGLRTAFSGAAGSSDSRPLKDQPEATAMPFQSFIQRKNGKDVNGAVAKDDGAFNRGWQLGDPYKNWAADQSAVTGHFKTINAMANPNAFSKWANSPEYSENIEDRRLTDKTLGGYKQLVKDADAEGMSQNTRSKSFVMRRGQFGGAEGNVGAPVPKPDPRGRVGRDNPFRAAQSHKE